MNYLINYLITTVKLIIWPYLIIYYLIIKFDSDFNSAHERGGRSVVQRLNPTSEDLRGFTAIDGVEQGTRVQVRVVRRVSEGSGWRRFVQLDAFALDVVDEGLPAYEAHFGEHAYTSCHFEDWRSAVARAAGCYLGTSWNLLSWNRRWRQLCWRQLYRFTPAVVVLPVVLPSATSPLAVRLPVPLPKASVFRRRKANRWLCFSYTSHISATSAPSSLNQRKCRLFRVPSRSRSASDEPSPSTW